MWSGPFRSVFNLSLFSRPQVRINFLVSPFRGFTNGKLQIGAQTLANLDYQDWRHAKLIPSQISIETFPQEFSGSHHHCQQVLEGRKVLDSWAAPQTRYGSLHTTLLSLITPTIRILRGLSLSQYDFQRACFNFIPANSRSS